MPDIGESFREQFPHYSFGERVADGCVHIVSITASLIAATTLVIISFGSLPLHSAASVAIYCIGLVAVFGFSAGYHLVQRPGLKSILRRCDHAAIFVKIAATYTPFAVIKVGEIAGLMLLGAVWAIAVVGVVANLGWPERLPKITYVLYLCQGWAGIAVFDALTVAIPTNTLVLIVVGGCLYTLGVVFHLWQSLPYQNAIWHGFVLTASVCLFAAIFQAVVT